MMWVAKGRQGGEVWIAAPSDAAGTVDTGHDPVRLIPVDGVGSRLTRYEPGGNPEVDGIPLTTETAPDEWIRELMKEKGGPFPSTAISGSPTTESSEVPINELRPGRELPVQRSASNRGLGLTVHGLSLRDSINDLEPSPGRRFMVLDVSFENRQAIDLLLEMDYPEPLMIGELPNQLFLLHNDVVVASPVFLTDASPLWLPKSFTLSRVGDRKRGKAAFEVPQGKLDGLSLVYVPELFPSLEVTLVESEEDRSSRKMVSAQISDDFIGIGVVSAEFKKEIDGFQAPSGMEWAVLELKGRGLVPLELDERAVNIDADPEAKWNTHKAAVYKHAHAMLQLVVDGRHAYRFDPALSEIEREPVFPPERFTGGRAVFPVPEGARNFELYAGFPDFRTAEGVKRPEPVEMNLEGGHAEGTPPGNFGGHRGFPSAGGRDRCEIRPGKGNVSR